MSEIFSIVKILIIMKNNTFINLFSIKLLVPILMVLFVFCPSICIWGSSTGTVEYLLSTENCGIDESDLGEVLSDAAKYKTKADIALVSSGLLYRNLLAGEADYNEISSVITSDNEILLCSMTGEELKNLLECSVSHLKVTTGDIIDEEASAFDGFLQISGLCVVCDVSAPTGERIISVSTDDGDAIDTSDNSDTYMVAITDEITDLYPDFFENKLVKRSGKTITEALFEYVEAGRAVVLDDDEYRMTGVRSKGILFGISPWIFVGVTAVFIVVGLHRSRSIIPPYSSDI